MIIRRLCNVPPESPGEERFEVLFLAIPRAELYSVILLIRNLLLMAV